MFSFSIFEIYGHVYRRKQVIQQNTDSSSRNRQSDTRYGRSYPKRE